LGKNNKNMNYLREKYTKEYFLNQDKDGSPKEFGVVGLDEYLSGDIRKQDKDILNKINFEGKTVLDIGFGRGEAIKYAYDHKAAKITGVDFSAPVCKLAKDYLDIHKVSANIICSDIAKYLKENRKVTFDIVLLLDVVEHIPRVELTQILKELKKNIHGQSVLVINTPVFKVDNDGYKDGINRENYEDSDEFEETQGMHINRYTKKSLVDYMSNLGYGALSNHYYVRNAYLPKILGGSFVAKIIGVTRGFPLIFPVILLPESFEYAYSRKYGTEPNLTIFHKIFRLLRWKAKAALVKFKIIESDLQKLKPKAEYVVQGPLVGRRLWLNLKMSLFWRQMLLGSYDHFIYKWLGENTNLEGKVVWDIGAHFGYHSLCFASLVGDKGRVVAIEPNKFNIKRFKQHLKYNHDLEKRITILECALSDKNGNEDFIFINEVDDSRSSGSHLEGVLPPEQLSVYKGFAKTKVKTVTMDSLIGKNKIPSPDILKIDVEGAEWLVLKGGKKYLEKYKPILLIEIHNILQMYEIQKMLTALSYKIELLEGSDISVSRCFVVATAG